MGVLYRAEQKRPSRRVVLKFMLGGRFATARFRQRFEREITAIGRLGHPNIVSIHECGSLGGQPYFTMEYVDGYALDEYASRYALGKREVCGLMRQVCDAVAYAHERGVVHRDLKPANVLVDRHGMPRVLDFGLAQLQDGDGKMPRATREGEVMGTPSYMSPEQTLGRPDEIDGRTDIYSVGVMLYELLTGQLPYDVYRAHPLAAAHAIRQARPRQPSTVNHAVDADLEAIIMKCLSKNKEARYPAAADLAAELRRYVQGLPVEARAAAPFYRLRKAILGRRVAFVPALAAGVLAVTLTAALAWHMARWTGPAPTDAAPGATTSMGHRNEQPERTRVARRGGLPAETTIALGEGIAVPLTLVPADDHLVAGASRPFYLSTAPVTAAQFARVMGLERPEGGAGQSAVNVPPGRVAAFCRRLTERTGLPVRLAAEAEWEYARRASVLPAGAGASDGLRICVDIPRKGVAPSGLRSVSMLALE